jgi:ankyrin repeat protein
VIRRGVLQLCYLFGFPVAAAEQDFIYHCREGNVERALEMVRENKDVLDEEDDDGATGLLWAVDRGNLDLVTALVEAGADIERCDGDGMAALHYAAQCGHAELVAYLLEIGARVDVCDKQGLKPEQLTEEPVILELLQQARLGRVCE